MNEPGDQKSQEQRPADLTGPAEPQVSAPANTESGAQKSEATKERKGLADKLAGFSPIFEMLLTTCAVVGLFLVIFQIYYMGESNRLTRESNDMMRQGLRESRLALVMSQRAEIGVETIATERFSKWGLPLSVRVAVRNSGHTTATRMLVISGSAYLPKPIQPNHPMNKGRGRPIESNGTLPAEATVEMSIEVPDLTEDAFEMVGRRKVLLYAYGEIIYLDGFENRRRTRFCAQYGFETGQWGQCPNNNEVE